MHPVGPPGAKNVLRDGSAPLKLTQHQVGVVRTEPTPPNTEVNQKKLPSGELARFRCDFPYSSVLLASGP